MRRLLIFAAVLVVCAVLLVPLQGVTECDQLAAGGADGCVSRTTTLWGYAAPLGDVGGWAVAILAAVVAVALAVPGRRSQGDRAH
jgi:hypothetical protein